MGCIVDIALRLLVEVRDLIGGVGLGERDPAESRTLKSKRGIAGFQTLQAACGDLDSGCVTGHPDTTGRVLTNA
jgi:hypothetical protein